MYQYLPDVKFLPFGSFCFFSRLNFGTNFTHKRKIQVYIPSRSSRIDGLNPIPIGHRIVDIIPDPWDIPGSLRIYQYQIQSPRDPGSPNVRG